MPGRCPAAASAGYAMNVYPGLQLAEPLLHALQAALDFFRRGGIGEPDMVAGAESLARNGNHVGLMQEAPGYVRGRGDPGFAEIGGDVGIDVKRALRLDAGDA